MHPIVIGTAGHIDHGKTALVRALTGIDTDRLAVEKQRGITTELGFARLDLAGRRIAVVDVPGHERFVKSMVAGASGLDLVMLVIAADAGVMPQTREHLDICQLLGVRRGIVVLAKADLAPPDWLELVTAEVRAALAGTFLEAAPIVPVSAKTGAGMATLKTQLTRTIGELKPRETTGVFRLPLDRVFTLKGFGTIVTGTALGGAVTLGDELVVIPGDRTARVRGLEVHGESVPRAVAGHRVAINLGGVAVQDLARGDLLAHPGRVAASHILDVDVKLVARASPIGERTKVLVHHGTSQTLATLALVEATSLGPGEVSLAQLRLPASTPIGAVPGDHFIVRGFSASPIQGSTLGGGTIIRVLAPRARTGAQHGEVVTALAAARQDQRLALDVRGAATAGLTLGELVRRTGVPAAALAEPLATLVATGELLAAGGTGDAAHYLHADAVVAVEQQLVSMVTAGGDDSSREALRTQLPAALPARAYDAILEGLAGRGALVLDGDRLRLSAAPARPKLSPVELAVAEQLRAARLEPPRPAELPGLLRLEAPLVERALTRLLAMKLAVRIKPDFVVHAEPLAELRERLLAYLDAHATLDAQGWKELTGASRKFTIPLAEYFDAQKVTLRIGDLRRRR